MQRGWALRKATDMLKDGAADKGSVVADWKERVAKVGGTVAFSQGQSSLSGSFKGARAHLRLP
eukprot:4076912-Alexandrium_andersonii.AAC.2